MKSSDIVSIVIVAMIGVLASYFAVNAIMGNPDDAYVSYKTIEVIEPELSEPDSEVFNADSINPTVEVFVGNCEDVDQDGMLSQAELVACGRASALDRQEESVDSEEESENKSAEEEESAENSEEYVEEGE